jgi:hypothetical protein
VLTLVAKSAEASETGVIPSLEVPSYPKFRLGDLQREFATSVSVGFGPRRADSVPGIEEKVF